MKLLGNVFQISSYGFEMVGIHQGNTDIECLTKLTQYFDMMDIREYINNTSALWYPHGKKKKILTV